MTAQLISIVGPTAVGKTALALWLAEELVATRLYDTVDLISADSRQVYRGLEITTGADIPADFTPQVLTTTHFSQAELLPAELAFFQKGPIRWHGVSLVGPTQSWSMGHFRQLVQVVTTAFTDQKRLIVIVGGTGLYHEYATSVDPQLFIPPDEQLREQLATQPVVNLQAELERQAPGKVAQLNDSDRQNPRRLIRAIEIAAFHRTSTVPSTVVVPPLTIELTFGVSGSMEEIETAIKHRVDERLQLGAVAEVEALWAQYPHSGLPAYSATGVKDILRYLQGQLEWDALPSQWALHELQYAKRQLTWWKKRTGVTWLDRTQNDWRNDVKRLIEAAR